MPRGLAVALFQRDQLGTAYWPAPFPPPQRPRPPPQRPRPLPPGHLHRPGRPSATGASGGSQARWQIPSPPKRLAPSRRRAQAWQGSRARRVPALAGAMRTRGDAGSSRRSLLCPWLDGAVNLLATGGDTRARGTYHRRNPGAKVEPMAGTDTAPRRWMLPAVLFAVVLASFGGKDVIVTYQRSSAESGLRRCPTCKWVELCPAGEVPWCEGVKKRPHPPIETASETRADAEPNRGDSRFYYPRK